MPNYDDDDYPRDDDGLPGMPMSVALIIATVVTIPIWAPFVILCLGAGSAVRLLMRRRDGK